jgi:hypothetical protein
MSRRGPAQAWAQRVDAAKEVFRTAARGDLAAFVADMQRIDEAHRTLEEAADRGEVARLFDPTAGLFQGCCRTVALVGGARWGGLSQAAAKDSQQNSIFADFAHPGKQVPSGPHRAACSSSASLLLQPITVVLDCPTQLGVPTTSHQRLTTANSNTLAACRPS